MKNLTILVFVILLACQPAKEGGEEVVDLKALKDEVFELHDEVMPMIGDLRKARKSLLAQVDSLAVSDTARAATFTQVSDSLNEANEGMMAWMRNFDPNFDGSDEEVLKYLTAQKTSIEEVNKNMKETLKRGEELLRAN